MRITTDVYDFLSFPSSGSTRNHGYAIERVECASVIILARNVLDLLESRKNVFYVSYSHVSTYGVNAIIGKRFHKMRYRLGKYDRIRVNRYDIIVSCFFES